MLAGLPASVAGTTINRFCSSGLPAITGGAHQIINESVDAAIGGGVESTRLIPRDHNPHPGLLEKMPGLYMVMGNNRGSGRETIQSGVANLRTNTRLLSQQRTPARSRASSTRRSLLCGSLARLLTKGPETCWQERKLP